MAKRKQDQRARRAATAGAKGQRRRREQRQRRKTSSAAAHRQRVTSTRSAREFDQRLAELLWPALVSLVFVVLGTLYFARWGPVVEHRPSLWVSPDDLVISLRAADAFVHGHFSSVYGHGVLAFPGALLLFAPIAVFSGSFSTTLVKISTLDHHLASTSVTGVTHTVVFTDSMAPAGAHAFYTPHPQALVLLTPYVLLVSCIVLFAADAVARRLGVTARRRALLTLVQAVLLWNVTVIWGHPEDAVAVALTLFALLCALDGRWAMAGWLFGAALAVKSLVIVILPLLLFRAGRKYAGGLLVRALLPAVALVLPPLVAAFHTTTRAVLDQPQYPNARGHYTPWTSLTPKLGGSGRNLAVGGGPGHVVDLACAFLVGFWARGWWQRPETVMWVAAVAFELRTYTESVMFPYYVWPALALAVVVAARRTMPAFVGTVVLAVFATVAGQWHLGKYQWWVMIVLSTTAVLIVAGSDLIPVRRRDPVGEPSVSLTP